MNSLFSLIKNRINFWLLLPVLTLLGILSSMPWIDWDVFLPDAISKTLLTLPQPKTTMILLLLFLAISACYLLLFVSYTQKPKIKDYEFKSFGYYVHKQGGEHLCPKCLLTPPYIKAPFFVSQGVLMCSVCGKILTG